MVWAVGGSEVILGGLACAVLVELLVVTDGKWEKGEERAVASMTIFHALNWAGRGGSGLGRVVGGGVRVRVWVRVRVRERERETYCPLRKTGREM